MDLDILRQMHARAVSSLASFKGSSVASDRERMTSPSKFDILGGYLRDIGRARSGEISVTDLHFVDDACDMRGLYWDTPATLLERQALDDSAALFLRLRDELANRR